MTKENKTYTIFVTTKFKENWKEEELWVETKDKNKFLEAKKYAEKKGYFLRIIITDDNNLEKPNFLGTIKH